MPEVSQSFDIDQPASRVWDFFQDVPQVVTCMPGLELVGQTGAATWQGKVKVRLGPILAAFEGEATIAETDAAARRARIEARGTDRKGGSRAAAFVVYEIAERGAGSRVTLAGDIKLTGALGQLGRTGIIHDVAAQLTAQFADALRAKLAAGAPISPPLALGDQGEGVVVGDTHPSPHPPRTKGGGESTPVGGVRFLLAVLWRRIKRALFG